MRGIDFDEKSPFIREKAGQVRDQATDQIEAVGAAVEGQLRLVLTNIVFQTGQFSGRDVRGVTDNEIEFGSCRYRDKQISLKEVNSAFDLMLRGILSGDFQSGGAEIDGGDVRCGEMDGGGDGNTTGTGSKIEDARSRMIARPLDQFHDENFGIGTGDQHIAGDVKIETIEFAASDQVGDGFFLDATFDEIAHDTALSLGHRLIEVGIELDARTTASVCQQDFGIQTGRGTSVLLEVLNRPIEDSGDRPDISCGLFRGIDRHSPLLRGRSVEMELSAIPGGLLLVVCESLQTLLAIELFQGTDQLFEIPLHDIVELVECQSDAMIRQSILGEVVGADPFVASA